MFRLSKARLSTVVSDSNPRLSSIHNLDSKRNTVDDSQRQVQDLQTQISSLWQTVWIGLYQLYDNHGPYHSERLTQLYFGAGMAALNITNRHRDVYERHKADRGPLGPLGLLGYALSSHGIARLRLFNGVSVEALKSVIQLLEAYKDEIAALGEVYELLRSLQVGLREPTRTDEKAVVEHYAPMADQLARRLIHLDARLDVLVADLEDEHMQAFGDSAERSGWLVKDIVYPKKGSILNGSRIS